MNGKTRRFNAVEGILKRAEHTLERAKAYEELFLAESGQLLLEELKDKKEADGCIGAFDEFLIECGLSHRLAPALAFEICTAAQKQGLSLPLFAAATAGEPQDICFVKNRYTEEVLPLISEQAGVYYAENFEEACALTAECKRQGCLLPYMGQDRLPLPGISRLIDEYDLKKHRLFTVDNGSQNTVYLLLCDRIRQNKEADRMEFLASGSKEEIRAVLSLAEGQGVLCDLPSPLRGLSTPTTGDETVFCRFTLKGRYQDLLLFSGVIKLCLPDSTPSGLYDTVELLEE